MIDINDVFVQCGICRDALDTEVKNEDLILVWPCDRCSEREYGQWAQKRIATLKAEAEKLRAYADLLERGMSAHEARGTIWPQYGEDK